MNKELLARILSLEALIAFPFITIAVGPQLAVVFILSAWGLDYRLNKLKK